MKYCTNCGVQIKEDTKFCTNCGTPVTEKDKQSKEKTIDNKMDYNSSISFSRSMKIVVGLIGVIALFFILKTLMTNIDNSKNPVSVSQELSKIEGKWYDPTGVLLGDKHAIIDINKSGDKALGQDGNSVIEFQLYATGSNKYEGNVIFHGVKGNFIVNYIKDKKELIFTNKLTKYNWKIKKF